LELYMCCPTAPVERREGISKTDAAELALLVLPAATLTPLEQSSRFSRFLHAALKVALWYSTYIASELLID